MSIVWLYFSIIILVIDGEKMRVKLDKEDNWKSRGILGLGYLFWMLNILNFLFNSGEKYEVEL